MSAMSCDTAFDFDHCCIVRQFHHHCFIVQQMTTVWCRATKHLFLLFALVSIMKPNLQFIDMEDSQPGILLTNEHITNDDLSKPWECRPILIDNEVGKDPINVLDALKYSPEGSHEFWLEKQVDKAQKNIGIRLPKSVYPPAWGEHELIRKKIIEAARQAGVELVRFKVVKKVRKNSHQHFTLRCKYGRRSAPEKPFVRKEGDAPHKGISSLGVPVAEYLPGCRLDPMQNKKNGIRGTKGEGKKMVRRTGDEKPAEEYGQDVCPVKFKVALIPGECWYLPFQFKSNKVHCDHVKLDRGEMSCRASHLSEKTKKTIKVLEEHVGCGSQSQNILNEMTGGFHVPTSVMQTVCHDVADKDKSSATLLIEHLNEQVDKGKMRYDALFHTVTTTSLLAISKAQKREELLKKKIVEAALKKADDDTESDEIPTLSPEELRELAGDLVKEGLKLYHTGRLKKSDNPIEIMVEKMEELLDFGSALCTVKENLQVRLCGALFFVASPSI